MSYEKPKLSRPKLDHLKGEARDRLSIAGLREATVPLLILLEEGNLPGRTAMDQDPLPEIRRI